MLCDFGSATAKVINPQSYGVTQAEDEIKKFVVVSLFKLFLIIVTVIDILLQSLNIH